MLSRLDDIIYPNRCEVIEIEASHRYIYPIYKNGSSSITEHAAHQKYKILLNEQIKRISTIDVVLREPTARYISGIKTFVHNTKRDNPSLDLATILYFAENYLFLNRHYAPQLSWLVQLSKYITNGTKLKLVGMESLIDYTPLSISPPETVSVEYNIDINIHNEMYIRLDNLLMNLIGKELTFKEILDYLKQQDPVAYQKLKCIALD
jgi:hypothetical protein